MKIRANFVANSSSSSYIVCKLALGNELYDELLAVLEKAEKEEVNTNWSGNGDTYEVENDYIRIGVHDAPKVVFDFITKNRINEYSYYLQE